MRHEFKVGDKVTRNEQAGSNEGFYPGNVGVVSSIEGDSDYVCVEFDGRRISNYYTNLELVKGKSGRPKKDNGIRYMAFETGCGNRSQVFKEEKDLREHMAQKTSPSGDHIGYKLVPICKAERRTVFTKIATQTKRKKERKRS